MTDPLEQVLKLVAEGRLTADEAAPILEALDDKTKAGATVADTGADLGSMAGTTADATADSGRQPRFARVEVRDHGKRVVDLRVPISLGRFALSRIPGLSAQQIGDVEQAVMAGAHGPILEVEDPDGDGVRIVLE
jgi:hypothetical protein